MTSNRSLKNIYQFINTLSFDVVIASAMTGIFACKVLSINIDYWWLLIIMLSVWVMYTADHLSDAWKRKNEITINRHLFHYHHFKSILPFWALAAIACVYLGITKLSSEIVFIGFLIGIGVMLYFAAIYFTGNTKPIFLQKELTIALIYVGGIWMAPVIWYGKNPDSMIWAIMANLVLLAWAEGIIVSWYEFSEDTADRHVSFTVLFGRNRSRKFIFLLLLIVLIFSISGLLMNLNNSTLLVAFSIQMLMSIVLVALILFPDGFKKNEIYRYVGEAVFMLQGLILLL